MELRRQERRRARSLPELRRVVRTARLRCGRCRHLLASRGTGAMMLVDVSDDQEFQQYLDRVEQDLYVAMAGVLNTAIRIRANLNGLRAQTYLLKRGSDVLLHTYQRIYRDQFR